MGSGLTIEWVNIVGTERRYLRNLQVRIVVVFGGNSGANGNDYTKCSQHENNIPQHVCWVIETLINLNRGLGAKWCFLIVGLSLLIIINMKLMGVCWGCVRVFQLYRVPSSLIAGILLSLKDCERIKRSMYASKTVRWAQTWSCEINSLCGKQTNQKHQSMLRRAILHKRTGGLEDFQDARSLSPCLIKQSYSYGESKKGA